MSKQKRVVGPERGIAADGEGQAALADLDPVLLEQLSLGNQALQDQIAGAPEQGPPGLDVVRDVASPMLDRGVLALQFLPRPGAEVARFVEILSRSHLADDRRQALVDRLLSDQSAAALVSETFQECFGADGEVWRSQLVALFEAVGAGLSDGRGDLEAGTWLLGGDRALALSPEVLEGGLVDRAGALLADLSRASATDSVRERLGERDPGESVTRFCRNVVLALAFDEEEEEEEAVEWGGDGEPDE